MNNEEKPSGLKEAYEMYFSDIYFFVKSLVNDREAREEIIAQSFIRLNDKMIRGEVSGNVNILSFLKTTSRCLALRYLKKIPDDTAEV